MSDTVRKVDYFYVVVPDKPGECAKVLSALAAKTLKLKLSPRKSAFLLQGDDRVGAMTGTLEKLAGAKINVTAMDAVGSGDGRYGAIFWVKPEAVSRAAKLLGAA
jgi:hypothetical protein